MCSLQTLSFFDGPCNLHTRCLCSDPDIFQAGHTIGSALCCIQDRTVKCIRNTLIFAGLELTVCSKSLNHDLIIAITAVQIKISYRKVFCRNMCILHLREAVFTILDRKFAVSFRSFIQHGKVIIIVYRQVCI